MATIMPIDVAATVDIAVEAAENELRAQALPSLVDDAGGFWSACWIALKHGVTSVRAQLGRVLGTGARHAPIVLAVLMFLFVTAETWEFFGMLSAGRFAFVLVLLALLTLASSLLVIDQELSAVFRTATRAEPDRLARLASTQPGGSTLVRLVPMPVAAQRMNPAYRLSKGQQWNIRAVMAAPLAAAGLLVATLVFLFFVLLGFLALDPALVEKWTGQGDDNPAVIWPVIKVAAVLAAFAWFTLAVEFLRDDGLKTKLIGDDCRQMKRWVALSTYCRAARLTRVRT